MAGVIRTNSTVAGAEASASQFSKAMSNSKRPRSTNIATSHKLISASTGRS